ncbi:four-carbon acid sugar kinase family protein [Aeoliella sp.]|uniref:four-carbon acid sugar kinase family protein n=1 Tax=Aeoliella sp. TaxID=2795800 RepID=UPI003CCBDD10
MTSSTGPNLRLAYYADDLTGATDAMERLELAGVPTALFLRPPTIETLANYPGIEAVGVAGATRAMPTDQLEAEVRPALASLRNLRAPHVHYKVCSTFDSSPAVGNIGRVIDVAAEVFSGPFIPVVVGTPTLGRWCVFGNLFASMGIGAHGPAFRLDRHPSISQHPTTPADESDLRLHLAKQTDKQIGLIDIRTLDQSTEDAASELERLVNDEGNQVVLFDTLSEEHFGMIGALVEPLGTPDEPLFWVGSSAAESVLTAEWNATGRITQRDRKKDASIQGPVLVLAGSCSPVTAGQVAAAQAAGMEKLTLTVEQLNSGDGWVAEVARQVVDCMAASQSVIVATEAKTEGSELSAELLGRCYGRLCQLVLQQSRPDLLVIAGGDTSSHTARSLPIECLEMAATLTTGAPVCRVASPEPWLDGLKIVLKGGQVGQPEFLANLMTKERVQA